MAGKGDTRRRIIEIAADLAREGGAAHLTFDAVAARLGTSKQAVIYWFPTKEDLIAGVALPALKAEAACASAAVGEADGPADAIERFTRAVVEFHLADLDRFRLVYLSPQMGNRTSRPRTSAGIGQVIHPVTSAMYGALETKLAVDKSFKAGNDPRRAAVAVHMAALGHVLLVAMADAIDDPLAHDPADLLDSLVALLTDCHASVTENSAGRCRPVP